MTSERKLTSERRKPSCAERSAALNEQISSATKTNNMRCMMALRYSDGDLPSRQGEVGADGEGERSRDQAGFPAAVPGADHDGDGEHHQPAFHDVGKHQGRDQSEGNTEDGDAVAEDGSPSRGNVARAEKGELQSHAIQI